MPLVQRNAVLADILDLHLGFILGRIVALAVLLGVFSERRKLRFGGLLLHMSKICVSVMAVVVVMVMARKRMMVMMLVLGVRMRRMRMRRRVRLSNGRLSCLRLR